MRAGTTKILTLFQPATGQVRLQPTAGVTNAILHPWRRTMLADIVAALPAPAVSLTPAANRALWCAWQEGLRVHFT